MIGVYRILNTKTNKSYIGSSTDIKIRMDIHFNNIRKKTKIFEAKLYNFEDYNFEVLKELKTENELESWENYFIGKYNSIDSGYNNVLARRKPRIEIRQFNTNPEEVELLSPIELCCFLKIDLEQYNNLEIELPSIVLGNQKRYIKSQVINFFIKKETVSNYYKIFVDELGIKNEN